MPALFNSAACFDDVRAGTQYYTNGYCVGNILIQISAVIALIYISFLFVWHMNQKGWSQCKSWARVKTWILVLLLIFEFIVVIRYTFNMYKLPIYEFLITFGFMVG
jgi:hypothetical protein